MKLGGHCVLFGPAIKEDTSGTLRKLSFAGAEGCEIGQRFFGLDARDQLTQALAENNIQLAGLHCNGLHLKDLLHEPEKAREALWKAAEFVAPLENKNVIATGSTGDPMEVMANRALGEGAADPELHIAENAETIARNLNMITREIKEKTGVQVHYHNHSWEFADNGLLWFALAEHAPDLYFALDTGWAAASGYDPVDLLDRYPERFHYVHLRDYTGDEKSAEQKFSDVHKGFITLGTGKMNYPRLMRKLNTVLDKNDWAIVEYEIGNFNENSYLRAISYLKGIRDML
jgi:sugar phosphate isomerase/epimerase